MKALKHLIQSIESALNNPAPDGDGAESADTLLEYLGRAMPYLQDQVWQPMDTVPKDGTPVLVSLAGYQGSSPEIHAAQYSPKISMVGGHCSFDMPEPTGWMPAPAPVEGETP